MRIAMIRMVIAPCLVVLLAAAICQAVPAQIGFQGVLDGDAGPVSDTLTMTFRLLDAETGGTPLWEEAQDVSVDQGIYNVLLGTGILNGAYGTLEEAILGSDALWLEVQVDGEIDAMSPRQPITSVGFAIRAGTVSDGAITAAKLASDAVTTDKLVDGAVTAAKVTGGAGSGLDADLLDGQTASDFGTAVDLSQAQVDIAALQAEVQALKDLLANVHIDGDTLVFSGINVQIVNGNGSTAVTDGTGNLIVGYNETRGSGDIRSGSHNIVVGARNNYASFGGFVAGYQNEISGNYASVSGGSTNLAVGDLASISGGRYNTASNRYASIGGGYGNTAGGYASHVSGGGDNLASGSRSAVSGGRNNTASGDYASIAGGGGLDAADGNQAFSNYSAVLGGYRNLAGDDTDAADHTRGMYAAVSGGAANRATGEFSAVNGGTSNLASGSQASVSGGRANTAVDEFATVGGGYNNAAVGYAAHVSGGTWNQAHGDYACVNGGSDNRSEGASSTVNGGESNTASGAGASILGGRRNTASGVSAVISGGVDNSATGDDSIVVGGHQRKADAVFETAGGLFAPDYDSGWRAIEPDDPLYLTHNLGGNSDHYVVDMQFRGGGIDVHQIAYGGKNLDWGTGAYWAGLTNAEIFIRRHRDDKNIDSVRIRIWRGQ